MSCRELVDQLFEEADGDLESFKHSLDEAGIPYYSGVDVRAFMDTPAKIVFTPESVHRCNSVNQASCPLRFRHKPQDLVVFDTKSKLVTLRSRPHEQRHNHF